MNKWQKASVIVMVIGVWFSLIGVHYEFDVIRVIGSFAFGFGIGTLAFEGWMKNGN